MFPNINCKHKLQAIYVQKHSFSNINSEVHFKVVTVDEGSDKKKWPLVPLPLVSCACIFEELLYAYTMSTKTSQTGSFSRVNYII